ncbi:MAG TPA: ZIP family metal transporter [Patescibacteria group bacterium]
MSSTAYAFVSVGIVSLISFVGAVGLVLTRKSLQSSMFLLVSFAVGVLFGDVFIHLLPESFEAFGDSLATSYFVLIGILLFFMLEKFIRWHHCHHGEDDHTHRHHSLATMNLVGDGLHNFIDGLLIGASYLVSIPVGVATTVAVIAHEIPTEIGDFGVLLHSGMSARKALLFNFYSALTAVVGVAVVLLLGNSVESFSAYLIPLTAGAFLYIAGSDLIPELHHHNPQVKHSIGQLLAIIAGITVMVLLAVFE